MGTRLGAYLKGALVTGRDGWVTIVVVILTCERHGDGDTYGIVECCRGRVRQGAADVDGSEGGTVVRVVNREKQSLWHTSNARN
jgi:hypothetical protein